MNKIFKKALATVCATATMITSGVVTSITASANNSSDTYWFTYKQEHSMYPYSGSAAREKWDDSSIYINNDGFSASRFYGTNDIRVSVGGYLTRSGYANQTYDISTRNGKIAYVGAVKVPKGQKRLIYQYVYENGVDKANSLRWPRGTYKIWASILIQDNIQTAGRWSPDSVGWYPPAQPF